MYQCPCCAFFTFDNQPDNTFEICPVCFWEDDGIQLHDEDYKGGANQVSLKQAVQNFKTYGACELRFKEAVRKPNENELDK